MCAAHSTGVRAGASPDGVHAGDGSTRRVCPVQFEGGLAEWAFTAGHGLKIGFHHSRDGDEIEIDGIGMVTVTGIPGSSIEEVLRVLGRVHAQKHAEEAEAKKAEEEKARQAEANAAEVCLRAGAHALRAACAPLATCRWPRSLRRFSLRSRRRQLPRRCARLAATRSLLLKRCSVP